eukprot:2213282-Heterocapsa_arctica.AAC.1
MWTSPAGGWEGRGRGCGRQTGRRGCGLVELGGSVSVPGEEGWPSPVEECVVGRRVDEGFPEFFSL